MFEFYEPPPAHLAGCAPEQALCYDFIEEAQLQGWRVLPEYPDSTLDLLLIAEEDCFTRGVKPGTQIGVQAKMQANLDLLRQMMDVSERRKGPDYIVALVPGRPRTASEQIVARAITKMHFGLFYVYEWFEGHHQTQRRKNLLDTKHLGAKTKFSTNIKLPEIETWTEPGVASPSPITQWKMRAIKFCIELEKLGKFDYRVFAEHKMHVQTWIASGWIVQDGNEGRRFLYRLNPKSVDRPDLKHPDLKMKLEKKKHAEPSAGASEAQAAKGSAT